MSAASARELMIWTIGRKSAESQAARNEEPYIPPVSARKPRGLSALSRQRLHHPNARDVLVVGAGDLRVERPDLAVLADDVFLELRRDDDDDRQQSEDDERDLPVQHEHEDESR